MTEASKYSVSKEDLTTYLIEDRRASLSPYGRGNSKLGPNVFTYSKLPGPSCPGATECIKYCWAMRLIQNKPIWDLWTENTVAGAQLPILPKTAKIVRIHVSGDFDSPEYVQSWIELCNREKDTTFWGYTRSWRLPEYVDLLLSLNLLPNVTIFASLDPSIEELPPATFRRAWIEGDKRLIRMNDSWYIGPDNRKALICPEEAGKIKDCETCGYCFGKQKTDLVFLKH